MMDFGCHRVEVLLNLLGPVDEVHGLAANTLFQREVEDTATACFRFRNGTMGLLAVSVSVGEPRDSLDLYGSEGSIHVPVLNQGTFGCSAGGPNAARTFRPTPTSTSRSSKTSPEPCCTAGSRKSAGRRAWRCSD